MEPSEVQRAVEAARLTACALGLQADTGIVVQNANRVAVRLAPCDVLARVAPLAHQVGAAFEVAVGRQLAQAGCPVEQPEPRVEPIVYVRDGFAITFWTYYESVPSQDITPAAYAQALAQYHRCTRHLTLAVPHFTDRIAEAQRLVDDRVQTPELDDAGRTLLGNTLRAMRRAITDRKAPEQLLHGEPHPGNLLNTQQGLLLIDLETSCRGPVEFDIAHAPEAVGEHYPAIHHGLLRECEILTLAMVTCWRWDRNDQFPNGRYWGVEGIKWIGTLLDRYGIDVAG
jgi:aminoglycoside phosphotransferase (APT) family kinase protein